MKTFHEVGLPKDFSRKKKLELYKCWIISKGDDLSKTIKDSLEINQGKDEYGLTQKAAISIAISEMAKNDIIAPMSDDNAFGQAPELMDRLQDAVYVIAKITLAAGTMDEELIVLPENPDEIDSHVNWDSFEYYDPYLQSLWCTIHNRISDVELHNYRISDLKLEIPDGLECVYKVIDANLSEIVLKS